MEYKIIKARMSQDLESKANELLNDRWKPQGGLVVTQDDKGMILCQALIRTEKKAVTKFIPPTIQEVRDYCKENKKNVDAEEFISFYESKGWMVGSTKMKSWQHALNRWHKPEGHASHMTVEENKERESQAEIWKRQGFESEEEYDEFIFKQTQEMFTGVKNEAN